MTGTIGEQKVRRQRKPAAKRKATVTAVLLKAEPTVNGNGTAEPTINGNGAGHRPANDDEQQHGLPLKVDDDGSNDPIVSKGGRERIELSPRKANAKARRCAWLLREVIYLRGPVPSALVKIGEVPGLDDDESEPAVVIRGVRHTKGSLILTTPSIGLLQYHLDKVAEFYRFDKRAGGWVSCGCPKEFVERLTGAATELGYRQCSGIVCTPLFIKGEIVTKPGYHTPTGSIIAINGTLPPIPERPTKEQALAAFEVLVRPYRGYLRDDAPLLKVAIGAGSLTAVLRASLSRAPAIAVDGNTPGAGKGKLVRGLCVTSTGSLPATITEGHNPEEMEKRITAAILSGASAILLDNLQREFASSAIESGLTEGTATIRLFGRLDDITVVFRALVCITANNAEMRADMLRRTLPIRIVVDDEEPEKRPFDFDPYLEAKRDRMEILAAGLTIARAWWQMRETDEGKRIRKTTLGSFEQWSDLVAGAVEWLTGSNPIAIIEERKASDPAREGERQLMDALHARFGIGRWPAKDAVGTPAVRDRNGEIIRERTGIDPEIWAEVLFFRGEQPTPKQVGKWLFKRKDKVINGLQLKAILDRTKTMEWSIHKMAGHDDAAGFAGFAGSVFPTRETVSDSDDSDDSFTRGGITPGKAGKPGNLCYACGVKIIWGDPNFNGSVPLSDGTVECNRCYQKRAEK